MRTLFTLLTTATVLFSLHPRSQAAAQAGPPAASAWERMTYPGEEFSAEWPEAPFAFPTTRSVKGSPFAPRERVHHFGVYSDGAIFLITSNDRPHRSESLQHFVNQLTSGRNNPGWEQQPGEVVVGDVKGVELRFENANSAGTARIFRTGRHAYIVRAISKTAGHPSVERFLSSFTLSKKPEGRAIQIPAVEARVEEAARQPPGPGRGGGETLQLRRVEPPPGAAGAASGPYRPSEVAARAIIVNKYEPGYTEEARRNMVTGVVVLRAVLTSDGKVQNISVLKGLPDGLTERAVLAAHCILFFPAEKDGGRVSQWVTLEYNFNIY